MPASGSAIVDQVAHPIFRFKACALAAADGRRALAAHAVRTVAAPAGALEMVGAAPKRIATAFKDQRPEIFGDMVWIAIHHAGGLPAHKVTLRIGALPFDAV